MEINKVISDATNWCLYFVRKKKHFRRIGGFSVLYSCPLINRARGPYWRILAWSHDSTDRAHTKTTEVQYFPVRLELARLESSLLYDTWAMLGLNLPAFESKTYTTYDRFHENGSYGEIPTTFPYNKV